jgi:hypothetical protein
MRGGIQERLPRQAFADVELAIHQPKINETYGQQNAGQCCTC